jgi:hypothetical protein
MGSFVLFSPNHGASTLPRTMPRQNFSALLGFLFLLASAGPTVAAQDWAWVAGSATPDAFGQYGTSQVSSANNTPGARRDAVSWTGANGDLWLYGGIGNSAVQRGGLSDLWRFQKSNGNWTWMNGDSTATQQLTVFGTQGVASPDNTPGVRSWSSGWTGPDGNLWLYGGFSGGAGGETGGAAMYGDLWKYDVTSGQWTWVSGSHLRQQSGTYGTQGVPHAANTPGSRWLATGWSDLDGNFWLFGGNVAATANTGSGSLQDLWKYDVQEGMWTWISGTVLVDQTGIPGTQGLAASDNVPAGRLYANGWTDAAGNLWLFGGDAAVLGNGNTFHSYMNDMWVFDVQTSQWTWVSGTASLDFFNPQWSTSYGSLGVSSTDNLPGPRRHAATWTDNDGNLWMQGGYGVIPGPSAGLLNDLWKFDVGARSWAWMGGTNLTNQASVFGTLGVVGSANTPGARTSAARWVDQHGDLWLFGGEGPGSANVNLNDLWMYAISGHLVSVAEPSRSTVPRGFLLSQAYPNPFNPTTQIQLSVDRTQRVTLVAYDGLGRAVARLYSGVLPANSPTTFSLRADGLPSGVYVIRAAGETFSAARRVMLVK